MMPYKNKQTKINKKKIWRGELIDWKNNLDFLSDAPSPLLFVGCSKCPNTGASTQGVPMSGCSQTIPELFGLAAGAS